MSEFRIKYGLENDNEITMAVLQYVLHVNQRTVWINMHCAWIFGIPWLHEFILAWVSLDMFIINSDTNILKTVVFRYSQKRWSQNNSLVCTDLQLTICKLKRFWQTEVALKRATTNVVLTAWENDQDRMALLLYLLGRRWRI